MGQCCAYCHGPGPFTREHVWPECFLSRIGRVAAHFSHKSGRVHGADYVVGDVCSNCNNVLLSPLDAYFCAQYDAYFKTARGFDAQVDFEYDGPLLERTILKIAYNSARGAGADLRPFGDAIEFVLRGTPRPVQLALFAELVSPTLIHDATAPGSTRAQLPENLYRSCTTLLLSPRGSLLHTRIVAVNSFYFHLVLPAAEMSNDEFHSAADELPAFIVGVSRIGPTGKSVALRSSPQDAISSIVPHVDRHMQAYKGFFEKRQRK